MAKYENPIWGIHAGKTGDADKLFLKINCVALGWHKVGDLSVIQPKRESFMAKVKEAYPDKKVRAIPIDTGQLYRFVHEMKKDDLVVYPSKIDKLIHVGRVTSDYSYETKKEPGYPHQRSVEWINSYPRTHFTQGALYEIGSAMSFFSIKNYADEFRAALEGIKSPALEEEEDIVAHIAEDIEYNTRDFILKRLSQELKGHPLAEFIAHLLNVMGYRTRVSPEGPDGGIDIIAHKDELGFEPPIIKVQVKSTAGSIGDPVVTALYGKVSSGEYGLFVTLGTFTNQAKSFSKSKSNLRLIDGDELVSLILQHYEKFDSQYKGLIPLRKVYVPEAIEKGEDEE